jgi:hypothetical protein
MSDFCVKPILIGPGPHFRVVVRLADRRLNIWRKISEANIAHPKDRTKLTAISGDLKADDRTYKRLIYQRG